MFGKLHNVSPVVVFMDSGVFSNRFMGPLLKMLLNISWCGLTFIVPRNTNEEKLSGVFFGLDLWRQCPPYSRGSATPWLGAGVGSLQIPVIPCDSFKSCWVEFCIWIRNLIFCNSPVMGELLAFTSWTSLLSKQYNDRIHSPECRWKWTFYACKVC